MQGTLPRLRPMSLGDLLDTTFALYRQNFALFAGIVAVLAIPEALINIAVQGLAPTSLTTTTSTGTTTVSNFNFGSFAVGLGLVGVISLIFSTLITGALATAISRRYLGESITIGEAYRHIGVGLFVTLVAASILEGIIVGIGFLLFFLPGIYLVIRFLFISQAIVIEGTGVGGAFGRSSELVRGSWWRVFGIALVLFLLVAILQGITSGVVGAILATGGSSRALGTAISAIIGILVRPIELGGLTLLYYDLRIRKEGFDIEHLASHMGVGRTP